MGLSLGVQRRCPGGGDILGMNEQRPKCGRKSLPCRGSRGAKAPRWNWLGCGSGRQKARRAGIQAIGRLIGVEVRGRRPGCGKSGRQVSIDSFSHLRRISCCYEVSGLRRTKEERGRAFERLF